MRNSSFRFNQFSYYINYFIIKRTLSLKICFNNCTIVNGSWNGKTSTFLREKFRNVTYCFRRPSYPAKGRNNYETSVSPELNFYVSRCSVCTLMLIDDFQKFRMIYRHCSKCSLSFSERYDANGSSQIPPVASGFATTITRGCSEVPMHSAILAQARKKQRGRRGRDKKKRGEQRRWGGAKKEAREGEWDERGHREKEERQSLVCIRVTLYHEAIARVGTRPP